MSGTLIVLGTAQDGGTPQMGSGAGRGEPRLVSSIAVVMDDGTTLLVDVTPDVKQQVGRLEEVPAYAKRANGNAVDHIALTHAHMGHYTGLVQFGREAHNAHRVATWVTPEMGEFLSANQPWATLVGDGHLALTTGFGPFEIAPGLTIRLVPVPHRHEHTDTVGISINNEVLFVPDIDSWEAWPEAEAEVAGHRVCLLDATFSSLDEVPGRELADIPHPLVADTLARFAHLTDNRRILLTHINHSNPIGELVTPAAERVMAAGFEVATENLTIRLTA